MNELSQRGREVERRPIGRTPSAPPLASFARIGLARIGLALACLACLLGATSDLSAQPPPSKSPPAKLAPTKSDSPEKNKPEPERPPFDARVAATVDGQPVTVGEVQREVSRVLPGEPPTPAALEIVQARALGQFVDRLLIVRQLASTNATASDQDVELIVKRIVAQLEPRKLTLADHLRTVGLDEPSLRRQIVWQICWEKYLDRYLTDENLDKFFQQHRREFDGSELRVAHILWKVAAADDPAAAKMSLDAALTQAKQLREQIASGAISFADAAAKHSTAPTAKMGGEIGWIRRHDPMPESFSKAAYALDLNAVSQPVVTSFGVHLIRCLEVKAGPRTWRDARAELEPAVTQFLFGWLADRQRPASKVEYTGVLPHFRPGTDELIRAK